MPAHLYTHFQFIACHVPTNGKTRMGDPVVSDLFTQQDLQSLQQVMADADLVSRFSRLMAMVNEAKKNEHVERDTATTLKIFAAPEFYFRPYDAANSRSYTEAEKTAFVTFLDRFFQDARFNDWMLVLGSIASHSDNKDILEKALLLKGGVDENTRQQRKQELTPGITVWNTALIAVGGVGVKTFRKINYSSQGDDIPEGSWPVASKNESFANADFNTVRQPVKKFFEKIDGENKTNCIFEVQGAGLFGFEICKDHMSGFIRQTAYPEYQKTHEQDHCKTLVFQVLTSCGAQLFAQNLELTTEGLFALAVDGMDVEGDWKHRAEEAYPQSQIQRVMALTVGQQGRRQVTVPVMCSWKLDDHLDKWTELNERLGTIAMPDSLKAVLEKQANNNGANANLENNNGGNANQAVRPQEIAIYAAQEFTAEMDPRLLQQQQQQQQQQQVNNPNNQQQAEQGH